MKSALIGPKSSGLPFCRSDLRWALTIAALLIAPPSLGKDPLQATGALERIDVQTCQLQCGRALAQCERARLKGTHCPRDYQFCRDECENSLKPQLTAAQQQERLCTQRCETSSALCEQATRPKEPSCRAGLTQCVARC